MNYLFPFEKLEIWQLAIEYVLYIYEVTKKFPKEEQFGITNQIRRSSNSVSNNIAEGASKKKVNEKARFFEVAYSSLMESLNQSIIAHRLKYLTDEEILNIRMKVSELSNKINSYYNKMKPEWKISMAIQQFSYFLIL